jgi:hypothetical protein
MSTTTKVIIYRQDQATTKLVELKNNSQTLYDLKAELSNTDQNAFHYNYIFYTTGEAVQIVEEDAILTNVNGRIFCELVPKKNRKQGKNFFSGCFLYVTF